LIDLVKAWDPREDDDECDDDDDDGDAGDARDVVDGGDVARREIERSGVARDVDSDVGGEWAVGRADGRW
jgi:hypothetical protein